MILELICSEVVADISFFGGFPIAALPAGRLACIWLFCAFPRFSESNPENWRPLGFSASQLFEPHQIGTDFFETPVSLAKKVRA